MDNGKGPYRYCERGDSHCGNMNCGCVNTCFYRMLYHIQRDQPGRALLAWWPWMIAVVAFAVVTASLSS